MAYWIRTELQGVRKCLDVIEKCIIGLDVNSIAQCTDCLIVKLSSIDKESNLVQGHDSIGEEYWDQIFGQLQATMETLMDACKYVTASQI